MGTLMKHVEVKDFIGLTFVSIKVNKIETEILFKDTSGRKFLMFHSQDCCEAVYIKDVAGDWNDLLGTPIVEAREETRNATREEVPDEGTWTFYVFRTIKGTVNVSWLGESNGYYSESVDLMEIIKQCTNS